VPAAVRYIEKRVSHRGSKKKRRKKVLDNLRKGSMPPRGVDKGGENGIAEKSMIKKKLSGKRKKARKLYMCGRVGEYRLVYEESRKRKLETPRSSGKKGSFGSI